MYTGKPTAARPARNHGAKNPIISLPGEGIDIRSTRRPAAGPSPGGDSPAPRRVPSPASVAGAHQSSCDTRPSRIQGPLPAADLSPNRQEWRVRAALAESPSDPERGTVRL